MDRQITLRQVTFLYLFISVSTILRQVPQALANDAGRSGYMSPVWSLLVTVPLTAIVILFLHVFPGKNMYEIMLQLIGTVLAKLLIVAYLLWLLIATTAKLTSYSLTMEFTLMPNTRSDLFMTVMLLMVFYGLLHGIKTIFRFSELTLGTVLVVFVILFVCAFSRLRTDYLLPVSLVNIDRTVMAAKSVAAVGGNIIIALFFADKYGNRVTKNQRNRLWFGLFVFTLLTFLITLFTFGISGTSLTKSLPFPFYITVKSISFFNVFERFEVIVTLICILSDFVAISIFAVLLFRCFEWLFHLEQSEYLGIPLAIILFYLTYYLSSTQFEFNYLYRVLIENLNMIFQYVIPVLLFFVYVVRHKHFKQQTQ